ncbi:hypothetical protein GCM10010441_60600 [Kitasatospora paracochleata]
MRFVLDDQHEAPGLRHGALPGLLVGVLVVGVFRWSTCRQSACRRSVCRVRGRCPSGPVDANRAPRADRARRGLLTIPQHCADVRLRYGGQGGPDPSPASVKDPTG